MKKIIALLLIVAVCVCFASCKYVKKAEGDTTTYTVTWAEASADVTAQSENGFYFVYIGKTDVTAYAVNLDDVTVTDGAFSVLEYLKEQAGLNFNYTNGDWGAFITSVGDLTPEGNEYISIYTTYEEDFNVPGPYTNEVKFDNKTFVTSGVGASSMHVVGGESVYLTIETY